MYSICLIFFISGICLQYLSPVQPCQDLPQFLHISIVKTISVHTAAARSLNVKLKVIHKKAFFRLQMEPLKKMAVYFLLGFQTQDIGREQDAVKTFHCWQHVLIAAQKAHRCIGAQIDAVAHGLKPSYHILHSFLLIHVELMPAVETQGCQTALLLCVQTGLHLF